MAPSLAREADIVALANDIGAGLDAEQMPRNRGSPQSDQPSCARM